MTPPCRPPLPFHRCPRAVALALALLAAAAPAASEDRFPATLAGHAILPAMTLIDPPGDAPEDARVSGKFTGADNLRIDTPRSLPGRYGLARPFPGQPLQGLSGAAMTRAGDGSVFMVSDNGFGSRLNSPDALLAFHRVMPDFATGTFTVRETVFLRDPDRNVPFRIAYEGTTERYLTGADFDPESIQVIGDEIWIGEEFGPYLIRATRDGRVLGIVPTQLDGTALNSPDAPGMSGTSVAGTDWRVPRSGGFEGLALQPGSGLLWAMLEQPILTAGGTPEGTALRALAFDPASGDWTGEGFLFQPSEGATAIGDLNFIDATRALVIERDHGEGDPSLACTGTPSRDCFARPARVKSVVLIDTARRDAAGHVLRIGRIDLMDIADPDGVARLATDAARDLTGRFTFPFTTIETVMLWDDGHILVGNDNNLPFSGGRRRDAAADNELILLAVPELLAAR